MWHHRSPTQTPGSTRHLHCSQGSVLLLTVPVFQWVALQIVLLSLSSALHPFLFFYASTEEKVPFHCLHNSVNMGLLVTVSQAFLKSLSRSTYIPSSCVKGILMQNSRLAVIASGCVPDHCPDLYLFNLYYCSCEANVSSCLLVG